MTVPKFRAWDKETETMYDVKSIVYTLGSMLCVNRSALFLERTLYFEDTPVMQYIGLLDVNGKEIFESDVVSWVDAHGILHFGVVEFTKGMFLVNGDEPISEAMEVIGNIYEHPDLVED